MDGRRVLRSGGRGRGGGGGGLPRGATPVAGRRKALRLGAGPREPPVALPGSWEGEISAPPLPGADAGRAERAARLSASSDRAAGGSGSGGGSGHGNLSQALAGRAGGASGEGPRPPPGSSSSAATAVAGGSGSPRRGGRLELLQLSPTPESPLMAAVQEERELGAGGSSDAGQGDVEVFFMSEWAGAEDRPRQLRRGRGRGRGPRGSAGPPQPGGGVAPPRCRVHRPAEVVLLQPVVHVDDRLPQRGPLRFQPQKFLLQPQELGHRDRQPADPCSGRWTPAFGCQQRLGGAQGGIRLPELLLRRGRLRQ